MDLDLKIETFTDLKSMHDFVRHELDRSDGDGKMYHKDEQWSDLVGKKRAIENEMYRRIDNLPVEDIAPHDPPRGDWR